MPPTSSLTEPPAEPPAPQFPEVLATVERDGISESVHRGHVAVAAPDGAVLGGLGDTGWVTYARSAAKPFQALATLELTGRGGVEVDDRGLAIACASHEGAELHQIEAAQLLALADLDESALRCPPALPKVTATLLEQRVPEPLAHNCSGKHGGFLLATVAAGEDPAGYLDPDSAVQRRVRDHLGEVSGEQPTGPGVDGCGAPAWVLPLRGLAVAFARLAAGATPGLERISAAMRAHPVLVGGVSCDDTLLMVAEPALVAKRGAEGVFGVGLVDPVRGPLGIAVKIDDGGDRAAGPVAAAILDGLGVVVPEAVLRPVVLGGGRPHGRLEPAAVLRTLL